MKSNEMMPAPWIASACPSSAVPTGIPAVRLIVDGPAKPERQASAQAKKSALRGRVTATGGYAHVTGAPADEAMSKLTRLFANGGLRGPHPWRQPVIT